MAEIKVSELPEASQINDDDLIMIVQSGTNKKITKENCQFASGDEIAISTIEPSEDEKVWVNPSETTNQAKYFYNDEWQELSIKALDSMAIGMVLQYVGTTIPTGWLECNGASITQSEYPELYALIGGTLPNFKGRVLVGQDTNDTDFDTLLETGGSKELQAHNHTLGISTNVVGGATSYGLDGSASPQATINTSYSGTGESGNLQPYAVVKHIIKAKNTTPTMASIVNAYSTSTQDAYSCDYVNDSNTYSTTEVNTGKTWIDGKPIYRKVGTGTSVSGGVATLNMNLTNIDTIVKYSGVYDSIYPIPYATTNQGLTIETYRNNTSINVVFGSAISANKPFVIIVEYTKSS